MNFEVVYFALKELVSYSDDAMMLQYDRRDWTDRLLTEVMLTACTDMLGTLFETEVMTEIGAQQTKFI